MTQEPIYGKRTRRDNEAEEQARLDTQLSQLTERTRAGVKGHWKLLVGVLLLVLVIFIGFEIIQAVGRSRAEARSARLFELTSALGEDAEPDLPALESYLGEVQGTGSERPATMQVVRFLIDRAESLRGDSSNPFSIAALSRPDETESRSDEEKAADAKKADALLESARKIVNDLAERHPNDEIVQNWATSWKTFVQTRLSKDWLPESRSFRLQAPSLDAPSGKATDASTPDATEKAAEGSGAPAPSGATDSTDSNAGE